MAQAAINPNKYGPLGYQVHKDAHDLDLDAKILCTSHNSRPGLGKTTFGIKFARDLDPNGWSAEEKAFLDPYEYMKAYDEVEPGSVLLLDEIEAAADSRRSNATQNVDLSHAWATKRYRNMITIATLPTTSMLDKRMVELSDYRVNVVRRGTAKAFEVKIPDFPPHRPWQEPMEGVIDYNDLADDDSDKAYLDELKVEATQVSRDFYSQEELDKKVKGVKRETEKAVRDKLVKRFYEHSDLSQRDIAEDVVDMSISTVNTIIND